MTNRAGLSCQTTAINVDQHIVAALQIGECQRLTNGHLQGFKTKVIVDIAAVNDHLAVARNEANTSNGLFAAADRLILNLCHVTNSPSCYYLTSSSTSGCCASCSCSAPAYTRSLRAIWRPSGPLGSMPRTACFTANSGFSAISLRYLVCFSPPT